MSADELIWLFDVLTQGQLLADYVWEGGGGALVGERASKAKVGVATITYMAQDCLIWQ